MILFAAGALAVALLAAYTTACVKYARSGEAKVAARLHDYVRR